MSNKKQTAFDEFLFDLNSFYTPETAKEYSEFMKIVNEAKEKVKLQMILFACDVHMDIKKHRVKSLMELVEEFYNETYGGNK